MMGYDGGSHGYQSFINMLMRIPPGSERRVVDNKEESINPSMVEGRELNPAGLAKQQLFWDRFVLLFVGWMDLGHESSWLD